MHDLNDLLYFAAVVEHGGFSAAARALGESKSKLSRRVAALEARLATRLLQRSTRQLTVTEVGQAFYAHAKAMREEAEAAEAVVATAQAEPCGQLRVACPIDLLRSQVGPLLIAFAARHPLVRLHVLPLNRPVDLVAEGVDLALRARPLPLSDSSLAMRALCEVQQGLFASPALVAELGEPHHPQQFSRWPTLGPVTPTGQATWPLVSPDGERTPYAHTPRLASGDLHLLAGAAEAGLGAVQLPWLLAADAVAAGRLVPLLPDWSLPTDLVHAVFASRRGLASSVRALLDYLAEGLTLLNMPVQASSTRSSTRSKPASPP